MNSVEAEKRLKRLGWTCPTKKTIDDYKMEIRAYWRKHGKSVPKGHDLYSRQTHYCNKGDDVFDHKFRNEAMRYGYGVRLTADEAKDSVRAYWKKHGTAVPTGHYLYNRQTTYCVKRNRDFDAAFRREAERYGYAGYGHNIHYYKDLIRAYWREHGKSVQNGHALYKKQTTYCGKLHRHFDYAFRKEAERYGYGKRGSK